MTLGYALRYSKGRMAKRKDQLPKSAVTPDNSLEWSELLARYGMAFHHENGDGTMALFLLALMQPDREMVHLTDYLVELVLQHDAERFKQAAEAFDRALKLLDEPNNPSLYHAIRYELEHQDEKRSASGLLEYWGEQGVEVEGKFENQLAYARRVRRRIIGP